MESESTVCQGLQGGAKVEPLCVMKKDLEVDNYKGYTT
jgi:hypothetical protein